MALKLGLGDTIAKGLSQIHEKTAYEVWIDQDGELRIEPLSVLKNTQVAAIELRYGENLISMDVGDLGQLYNRVEVYGAHPKRDANGRSVPDGAAQDDVAIAQMGQVRTYVVRDRSLGDGKSCLLKAQEKLLDLMKNFKVDATTIFLPTISQGDCVTITNPYNGFYNPITGAGPTFIVQNVKHSLKPNGATTQLQLFGGIIDRLPEKAVKGEIYTVTKSTAV
jgi:hypothetical protein